MGIRGDVRSIPLASVLQDLAMNEKTGTLSIRAKDHAVSLWFERGAIRLVGVGPREGPSLLNGLLALEKLSPEEAPTLTGKGTREGGFVRSLVKKGRLGKEDLKAALEHQMSEHLCDAFLWGEATFEFEEGEPDDRAFDVDQLDLEPRLAADGVIMEALRRADEWGETRKAILSSSEILVPDASRVPPEADSVVRRVFSLLDGERTLRDVEVLTRLGHFVLLRAAALLIRSGAARPVSAAEAFERGRARAAKKDWPAALRMARYGLDHERKNLGLLELALQAAEQVPDAEAAASYARQVAAAQVESGHLEHAVRAYQKVLAHAPRDLTAHERLFELLLQLDLRLDALAAGEALAGAYKKAGLSDKALAVYQRLVEKLGDQVELLESVAEIQRHLGDRGEAVKTYGRLLAKAMEAKNDATALDYCRTILRIEPKNAEALELRQQLESGEVDRARKRRRLVKSLAAVSTLTILVFVAAVYEWNARSQHGAVANAILDTVAAGNRTEALRLYDSVLDAYRYSVKARELRPQREKVEEDFLGEELARGDALDRHGQLAEAVAVLEAAKPLLRQSALQGRADARLADLRRKRSDAEREWDARLARMAPPDVAAVSDPLAVPALEKLLRGAPAPNRAAALKALSELPGDAAAAALLVALSDSEAPIRGDAAAALVARGKTPFRAAVLPARPAFPPGDPTAVEWRITNLSPAEVELQLDEAPARRLEVLGPSGKLKLTVRAAGPRLLRLGPGEFVGGTFMELGSERSPGRYQLTWSASVTWNGKPVVLPAAPASFERSR
jgi:tetratricopeptide (TPR) repeat protein